MDDQLPPPPPPPPPPTTTTTTTEEQPKTEPITNNEQDTDPLPPPPPPPPPTPPSIKEENQIQTETQSKQEQKQEAINANEKHQQNDNNIGNNNNNNGNKNNIDGDNNDNNMVNGGNNNNDNDLPVQTVIELLWPPSNKWQTGVITHSWKNGEYAIRFEDDPFDDPLTYRLAAYQYRIVSKPKDPQPPSSTSTTTQQQPPTTTNQSEQQIKNEHSTNNNNNSNQKSIKNELNNNEIKQENENENENGIEIDEEFEVDAVIDFIQIPNGESLYRVKWKRYDICDCTWEPKEHLDEAKEVLDLYKYAVDNFDFLNKKSVECRADDSDKELLNKLHGILSNGDKKDLLLWQSQGRAFKIINQKDFGIYLKKSILPELKNENKYIKDYSSFMNRLSLLGFEQQRDEGLFHHPCFAEQDINLIKYIGINSVPLPNTQMKINLLKSIAKKEQKNGNTLLKKSDRIDMNNNNNNNEPINKKFKIEHNYSGNDNNGIIYDNDINKKRSRKKNKQQKYLLQSNNTILHGMNDDIEQQYRVPQNPIDFVIPLSSGLDLNQCHLWTEDHVAEWIRHMPNWGHLKSQIFRESGVDGRILLESDIDMICDTVGISINDKPSFILGVNQLRTVRLRSMKGIQ